MKLTPIKRALRVSGVIILALAGIRLATDVVRTSNVAESASPTGFIVGVSFDYTTLALTAIGALVCVLGFRSPRRHT